MRAIENRDLTPYGKHFVEQAVKTGTIRHGSESFSLRENSSPDTSAPSPHTSERTGIVNFGHVSRCLVDAKGKTLASRLRPAQAKEFDDVFAACAVVGDDEEKADGLVKHGPEMRGAHAEWAALLFGTALTINGAEHMERALKALGQHMDARKCNQALLDGFNHLSAEQKAHAVNMRGGPLFAAAFSLDNREEMGKRLLGLEGHLDSEHCARLVLSGFEALSESCKIRVADMQGAPLFAAAFSIADISKMNEALKMLQAYMVPSASVRLMLDGLRLLPEAARKRVTSTQGELLFATAFIINDIGEMNKTLETLETYADPANRASLMLDGFRLLPEGEKKRLRDVLYMRLRAIANRVSIPTEIPREE
ncbi:hypothetical protein [Paraburkholderia sediminicola]|uniref:hypothetical protein n=1 Tax=Paraburkholderia sediminicola TaxID=458836 RepID=UPI0038B9A558